MDNFLGSSIILNLDCFFFFFFFFFGGGGGGGGGGHAFLYILRLLLMSMHRGLYHVLF